MLRRVALTPSAGGKGAWPDTQLDHLQSFYLNLANLTLTKTSVLLVTIITADEQQSCPICHASRCCLTSHERLCVWACGDFNAQRWFSFTVHSWELDIITDEPSETGRIFLFHLPPRPPFLPPSLPSLLLCLQCYFFFFPSVTFKHDGLSALAYVGIWRFPGFL